jgi:hypothetical protein
MHGNKMELSCPLAEVLLIVTSSGHKVKVIGDEFRLCLLTNPSSISSMSTTGESHDAISQNIIAIFTSVDLTI